MPCPYSGRIENLARVLRAPARTNPVGTRPSLAEALLFGSRGVHAMAGTGISQPMQSTSPFRHDPLNPAVSLIAPDGRKC